MKKIRLKGFKSFANQTDIEIEENITAVVGPNGSGKSNIVDAIRWVLGEQSAKTLRGSRMSDIIFSGSEELSPKRSASVTLFFDNSEGILPVDGKELTLGRRVDNDGRSDYLINGASCRLKDIDSLLMDSGMGSEGYSIVGQGRIDSIIHSKPDKMRLFFEEAAGIMKHKSRKEDAEKRLENTTNDLQRIHDLVDELEKRREPLKKAAAKTEKFKHFKAQLSELEISLLNKQWKKVSKKYEDAAEKRAEAEKELEEKNSRYNSLDYKLESQRDKLKELKTEKEEVDSSFFQTQNKLNEIKNNINLMNERSKNFSRQKEELKEEIESLEIEKNKNEKLLKQTEENFKIINSDKSRVEAKIDELNNEIAEVEQKLENNNLKITEKESDIHNFREDIQKKKSLIERLEERIDISSERLDELEENSSELEKILEEKKEERSNTEKELAELSLKLDQLVKKIKDNKDQLDSKQAELESGKEELQQLKEEFQHKSSRLELMQEMQEGYEGYYYGVKNLLQNKGDFPGIIDVVAEIISADKEYEKAVETALGAKMQNIVVEDDKTAKKAVQFLKKNSMGRATFLPLNMVEGKRVTDSRLDKLRQNSGFIGLAVELVEFPDRLRGIFDFLLGNIAVSDNLQNAVKMSKKINKSMRIVSREGDVVYPGGAISGGSSSKSSKNLIGRSRKIEKLKKAKSDLKNKAKKIVAELEKLKEEIDRDSEILAESEAELQQLKIEENSLQKNNERLDSEINELESRLSSLNEDSSRINSSSSENKSSIDKKREEIIELKENIKKAESFYEKLRLENEELQQTKSELKPQLKELELDGARISEKKENIRKELGKREAELEKSKNLFNDSKTKLAEINSNLKRIEKRSTELKEKRTLLEKEKSLLGEKRKELKEKLDSLEAEVEKKEKVIKSLQKSLNKIKDEFHELDLKYSSLKNKLENIVSILKEDYSLQPEDIDESELLEIEDDQEAEVESEIKRLKSEIRALHPVNEAAVEEFSELKNRLDYLHEQQEDLKHARRSIEIVIGDIEKSMKKMFSSTFFDVKEEFTKVFRALFQGGEAELKLTNPEDMLETGVEIHAQPPGKSLKTLSLLSGGERALTAIALIFAFIQVKPSPFYVLDEIDAPLDDVNIVRFASFIKRYSKVAQFIIITHRRYMMTEVDSLYGVTMEKSGVSRLISLKLDQEEELDENLFEEAL